MQKKLFITLSLILTLAFMLTACSQPAAPTVPPLAPTEAPTTEAEVNAFRTLVAGTLTAVATLNSPTPAVTDTPTATLPAPTDYPTPMPQPTQEIVTITINEGLNCRQGPATYYPILATLPIGTVVQAFGIDQTKYWYNVQNPNKPDSTCWLWGASSTVNGRAEILPLFTPMPTPRPTYTPTPVPQPFTAVFAGVTKCGSGMALNFNITNTGTLKLESVKIESKLAGTDSWLTHMSDKFTQWSNGAKYKSSEELLPKEAAIVSTCNPGQFPMDVTGNKIKSEVTVCSRDGLAGTCYKLLLELIP